MTNSFDESNPIDRMLVSLVDTDLESAKEILEILEKDPDEFLLDQFGELRTVPRTEIVQKLRSLITEHVMRMEEQSTAISSEDDPHGKGPAGNV